MNLLKLYTILDSGLLDCSEVTGSKLTSLFTRILAAQRSIAEGGGLDYVTGEITG